MTLREHLLTALREVDPSIWDLDSALGAASGSREWVERLLIPALDAQGLILRRRPFPFTLTQPVRRPNP